MNQCDVKDILNSPSSNYPHEAHLVYCPMEVLEGKTTALSMLVSQLETWIAQESVPFYTG